jgi:phage shock protein A
MRAQGYRRAVALPGGAPAGSAMMRAMSSAAEISSLSSSMEELHRRVTAMAQGALDQGDEDMAHELIAVERALGGALRRLQRYASR